MSLKNERKKTKKKRNLNIFYNFVKFTGAIPVLFWIRPKVVYCGTQKKRKLRGGALIVSNHVSMTDPLSLLCTFWYRIPRFVATKEIFRHPAGNFFFTAMHCIKVDRENFNMSTFHEVSDELARKKAVVFFPEGQINESSGGTMPFKAGAILMAYKNGVPVLPVCIVDRKKWYRRQVVLIGDPVDVRARCGSRPSIDALNAVSEELRLTEAELLERYTERKNKKRKKEIQS